MAVSPSRMSHLLGEDAVFQSRCKVQMLDVADNVLAEQNEPHHAERYAYAKMVISAPDAMARTAAAYLARSTNVVASGIEFTDQGVVANIDDAGLLSQVMSSWNAIAGVDEGTGPVTP